MSVSFNHFHDLANAFYDRVTLAVKKVAFDLQANVQKQITANGQVVTGFMRNSVYVVTNKTSTYEASGDEMLPQVETPPDPHTAYVAVGASYAIYPNYGTRYMPAKPFWEPAIEETRRSMPEKMATLISLDNLSGTITGAESE